MIDKHVYEIEYIRELQKRYVSDPGLLERAIYAFGLLEAIKAVGILLSAYNTDDATWKACKVMYLASCLISGKTFAKIENPDVYITARLEGDEFKKLAYVRKQRPEAYALLVEATRNLKSI